MMNRYKISSAGRWLGVLAATIICVGIAMQAISENAFGPYKTSRQRIISTACFLDGEEWRNKGDVFKILDEIPASKFEQLVVTPFMPFFIFKEGNEEKDLRDFRAFAKMKNITLIVAMIEEGKDGKVYHSSVLITPDASIAGKYRKSHKVADDGDLALGDELPVFKTSFGKIGLTLTSDFYFPEVYEVLRMKGAEVLVWQHYPERLREHFQWLPLLFARAYDSHAFFVTAHYADARAYIANNYNYGMQGAAFGRSMVIDRSGTPRADTGYRHGAASVTLDLDERKKDVYSMTPNFENLFYVPNNGGRKPFAEITGPCTASQLPEFKKRTARIAIATTTWERKWNDGTYPEAIMELLGKAASYTPDLVMLSEQYITKPEHPQIQKGLTDIAKWAADHKCYVLVGGLGNKKYPDGAAYIWDRTGELVYVQPRYWTWGMDEFRVLDTDFARIAAQTCGDLFTFPISRILALKGAEIIFDPTMMWGPDGFHNVMLKQARAIDNGCYFASAHWVNSDPALRSMIVDPYGQVIVAAQYRDNDICVADIDFSRKKVFYSGEKSEQPTTGASDIEAYFSADLPARSEGWREMIFENRRPELYSIIPTENEVTIKYIGKQKQAELKSK
jgi:predicted amidohydrolase